MERKSCSWGCGDDEQEEEEEEEEEEEKEEDSEAAMSSVSAKSLRCLSNEASMTSVDKMRRGVVISLSLSVPPLFLPSHPSSLICALAELLKSTAVDDKATPTVYRNAEIDPPIKNWLTRAEMMTTMRRSRRRRYDAVMSLSMKVRAGERDFLISSSSRRRVCLLVRILLAALQSKMAS
jgi:hypothetical protein